MTFLILLATVLSLLFVLAALLAWPFVNELLGALFRILGVRRYYPFWTKHDIDEAREKANEIMEDLKKMDEIARRM